MAPLDQEVRLRRRGASRVERDPEIEPRGAILTSATHPLRVGWIRVGPGRLGVTLCPGKRDPASPSGRCWDRDLSVDLDALVAERVDVVVTLVEAWELDHLGVPNLGAEVRSRGMRWTHLPIRDVSVPAHAFMDAWRGGLVGATLGQTLSSGGTVVVHCRGGLGRAGTVASMLLVDAGRDPGDAIREVRAVRPGAVETVQQERFVHRYQR